MSIWLPWPLYIYLSICLVYRGILTVFVKMYPGQSMVILAAAMRAQFDLDGLRIKSRPRFASRWKCDCNVLVESRCSILVVIRDLLTLIGCLRDSSQEFRPLNLAHTSRKEDGTGGPRKRAS